MPLTSLPNSNHSTTVEAHAPTVLQGLRARELGATIDHLEQRIRSMAAAANGLRKAFDA